MSCLRGSLLVAGSACAAVLVACGSSSSSSPSPTTSRSLPTTQATGVTGIAQVDPLAASLVAGDAAAVAADATLRPVACQASEPSLSTGLEPQCAAGVEPGTQVDAFVIGDCEGHYVTSRSDLQSAIQTRLSNGSPHAVYAVVKGGVIDSQTGRADPAVADTIVLTDASTGAEPMISLWSLSADGKLITYYTGCSQSTARLAALFGETPTFLYGPLPTGASPTAAASP